MTLYLAQALVQPTTPSSSCHRRHPKMQNLQEHGQMEHQHRVMARISTCLTAPHSKAMRSSQFRAAVCVSLMPVPTAPV